MQPGVAASSSAGFAAQFRAVAVPSRSPEIRRPRDRPTAKPAWGKPRSSSQIPSRAPLGTRGTREKLKNNTECRGKQSTRSTALGRPFYPRLAHTSATSFLPHRVARFELKRAVARIKANQGRLGKGAGPTPPLRDAGMMLRRSESQSPLSIRY
ncbi:hypothetical protein N656DRAFT_9777 [Canariomyces notabilis]|uniref:Uncharacterized protein n=1 Tax=Canariomyces notabilis TaxID=2074819 RepID=A0AAN6YWW8_9PEZI|nr:hypothetical protein N656DRAFT_9777 [Canariomyces arenarius]